MSQQHMDFNEAGPQHQAGYEEGYQSGYRDPFVASYGQKLGQAPAGASRSATSGQRLALAIVSVVMLAATAISLFSSTNLITAGILAMLMGFLVVFVLAIALMVINWVFNRR